MRKRSPPGSESLGRKCNGGSTKWARSRSTSSRSSRPPSSSCARIRRLRQPAHALCALPQGTRSLGSGAMKVFCVFLPLLLAIALQRVVGQIPAAHQTPDVSNKTLLTKPGPSLEGRAEAMSLHKLADDYYDWRNIQFPVGSSNAGLHTWDDRLTDSAPKKSAERAQYIRTLLEKVNAIQTASWPKDEQIDWMLFRAQLENAAFDDRVWHSTSRDPQTYVG